MEVELFIPCFIEQVYPETGINMIKILKKIGIKAHYNPQQSCCGQPFLNSGYWQESKVFAEKFLKTFDVNRFIIIPSASCAGFIKNYYTDIFKDDINYIKKGNLIQENVFEFTDFLVNKLKINSVGAKFPYKVTYHDSCAALRECNIKAEPRELLKNVEGLQLIEMEDTDVCCGFGGTFSVKFKSISEAMAEQKVQNALNTQAEYIVTTDSSCIINIEGYIKKQKSPITAIHIADILANF